MRITSTGSPISITQGQNVRLGIGRAVKRDAVLVKVATDGVWSVGAKHIWTMPRCDRQADRHHDRELVVGMDAMNVVGVWHRVYQMQLASHGMGYAAAMALSGLDLALWDIRAKAAGWPLYRLLGGTSKPIKAYAGGISLGWQAPESLAEEALGYVAKGYRAVKLRVGDNPRDDLARAAAVRKAVGDGIDILVDANTGYTLEDARRVMPGYDDLQIGWLEEPFPAQDYRSYQTAASFGLTPLAAGENHYTRFEFTRLIEDHAVSYVQPDLSKTGGITVAMRFAGMVHAEAFFNRTPRQRASTWRRPSMFPRRCTRIFRRRCRQTQPLQGRSGRDSVFGRLQWLRDAVGKDRARCRDRRGLHQRASADRRAVLRLSSSPPHASAKLTARQPNCP